MIPLFMAQPPQKPPQPPARPAQPAQPAPRPAAVAPPAVKPPVISPKPTAPVPQTAPPQTSGSNRRRSQRVILQVPIIVHGRKVDKEPFSEDTATHVVNAHGALIGLAAGVKQGQELILEHRASKESQEGRVVFLGPKQDGKNQVGIEFTRPRPHFWHIDFPPEDWKPTP
ncbi:MAG: hypothetical protein HY046_07105 [Acidobacteria bacterium]|nr:hypothetical protein [Acidobacteriota bacterium]